MSRHRSEYPQTQNARVRENAERLTTESPVLAKNLNSIFKSDPKAAAMQAYQGTHRSAHFADGYGAARSN